MRAYQEHNYYYCLMLETKLISFRDATILYDTHKSGKYIDATFNIHTYIGDLSSAIKMSKLVKVKSNVD